MPPLALYPSMPQGYPDIRPGTGDDSSSVYAGQYRPSSNGYGGYGQDSDYVTPEEWAAKMADIKAAYQASAGFERLKLKAQYEDAEKARQNSLRIAQLQADTSRYGVDQQRLTAIEQLKQRDKEFAANHQLDTRKADIEEAQIISSQRSEPSRLFQTMDLEQALGSIRNGQRATTMPMTGVAALDHLSTDYTSNPYLSGGGAQRTVDGRVLSASSVPDYAGQSAASGVGTNTSAQATDPRLKIAADIVKALPPSATEGLDPTGVSALNAVYSLYNAPLRPGTLETLSPTQKATLQSGSQRIQRYTGRSYDDLISDYRKSLPGQGAANAA